MDPLRQHLETLASGPRVPGTAGHAAALRYIERTLTECGWRPQRHPFDDEGPGVNLIAERGPRQGPLFIVGAHYDSVPGSPGADDNASGVAALLELARSLKDVPLDRTRLCLAAYDREEEGLIGSRAHCRSLRQASSAVEGMLSLEMLGYVSAAQSIPSGLAVSRVRGDFLAVVANPPSEALLAAFRPDDFVERVVVPPDSVAALMAQLSDHGSFWDAGWPALLVTDTAFLRNPHYHRETDTPDRLDYAFLRRSVDVVAAALATLLA